MMYFIVLVIVFIKKFGNNNACNLHFYKSQLHVFGILIKKIDIVINKNEFAVSVF